MNDVVSDLYTGRYHRAFLDYVAGPGRYTVRSLSLRDLATTEGLHKAFSYLDDDDLALAYMSDTKLTLVWMHDYPGWLNFCDAFDITIRPSQKIAKRLTIMTRLAYLAAPFAVDTLKIAAVGADDFTEYSPSQVIAELGITQSEYPTIATRFLDGANVISVELLESLITAGSEHVSATSGISNPWEKRQINCAVDRAGTFSFRLLGPQGLIKGDAIAAPRDAIGGYDVLYCAENLKTEVKCGKFVFVLAEPHPGIRHEDVVGEPAPPPVWSDDQSMSWLGEWLYPKEQLLGALRDYAHRIYTDLKRGHLPRFFTDVAKRTEQHTSIADFQEQALIWQERGLGVSQSIFLTNRVAQGAINKLAPSTSNSGDPQSEPRRRFPVPCAMYVHVATDSWLHMAGSFDADTGQHPWPGDKPFTPRGHVWYHEPTGRLIYNDVDFAQLYDRHGGWDLDDSVRAHARTLPDGTRVWVIVRSPNSYGEYDIKRYIDGTYAPTWPQKDGTRLAFPPIADKQVPFLEELDISYSHPTLGTAPRQGEAYTQTIVKRATVLATKFAGLLGRRLNADMAYFQTTNSYRSSQLAPVEAIVDACTQTQTMAAHKLIDADVETVVTELVTSHPVIDRKLWNDRIRRRPPRGVKLVDGQWTWLWSRHDTLCDVYTAKLQELSQQVVNHLDERLLALGMPFKQQGQALINWYYSLVSVLDGEKDQAFYRRINTIIVDNLLKLDTINRHHFMLGAAAYCYTTKHNNVYRDTPLFVYAPPPQPSVFQCYLEALEFYGLNDDEWQATITCQACDAVFTTTDRLEYQRFVVGYAKCPTCVT